MSESRRRRPLSTAKKKRRAATPQDESGPWLNTDKKKKTARRRYHKRTRYTSSETGQDDWRNFIRTRQNVAASTTSRRPSGYTPWGSTAWGGQTYTVYNSSISSAEGRQYGHHFPRLNYPLPGSQPCGKCAVTETPISCRHGPVPSPPKPRTQYRLFGPWTFREHSNKAGQFVGTFKDKLPPLHMISEMNWHKITHQPKAPKPDPLLCPPFHAPVWKICEDKDGYIDVVSGDSHVFYLNKAHKLIQTKNKTMSYLAYPGWCLTNDQQWKCIKADLRLVNKLYRVRHLVLSWGSNDVSSSTLLYHDRECELTSLLTHGRVVPSTTTVVCT